MGPFTPGRTVALTVGNSSIATSIDADAPVVRLLFDSSANDLCFVRIGNGSLTATTGDFPIPSGVSVLLTKGVGANVLAAISSGVGTDTLYITTGSGT